MYPENRRPVTASVESTRDSIRIVLAEEKSARTNRKVFLKNKGIIHAGNFDRISRMDSADFTFYMEELSPLM